MIHFNHAYSGFNVEVSSFIITSSFGQHTIIYNTLQSLIFHSGHFHVEFDHLRSMFLSLEPKTHFLFVQNLKILFFRNIHRERQMKITDLNNKFSVSYS